MKTELDEKLCKDHPKIFANRNGDMQTTAMCWGFECGDGWYDIINNLCHLIQGHIDFHNKKRESAIKYNEMIKTAQAGDFTLFDEYYAYCADNSEFLDKRKKAIPTDKLWEIKEEMSQVVAEQVKEKFGTLRFYTNGTDDYISGAISMAESMSANICEVCGKPGRTNVTGWLEVRCSEHE